MKPLRILAAFSPVALAFGVVCAPAVATPTAQALGGDEPTRETAAHRIFNLKASYAQNKPRDDQGEARKEMKAGNQLSLREIEKRVLPKMRGAEYLGPAYDAAAHAYRLKFIKDGRVMYVDVDARTGKIINRSR